MSDSDLLNTAFDVARRLRGFESYGRSQTKALAALCRRCPDHDRAVCEQALNACVELYDAAVEIVAREHGPLYDEYERISEFPAMDQFDEEVTARVPGIPPKLSRQALQWVFFWHHLK